MCYVEIMSNYNDSMHHRLSVDSARDATDSSDDERQNTSRNKLRVRRNIDEVSDDVYPPINSSSFE